jgi:curved DNA-binding protein CbpA
VKNHYSLLGIAPDAELETIKAAYRQLVHRHHPDRNSQDPAATERFLEIQEAYETLTDENLRLAYDEEFVATFPGYTLDEEEDDSEEWQENPPASMPVDHDDGSNSLLRILMVLILPLFAGGMVMNFTGDILWTVIAAFSALVGAFWIGQYIDNE